MQKDQPKHTRPRVSIQARLALLFSLLTAVTLGLLASASAQTTPAVITLSVGGDGGLIQATDGNFYGTSRTGGYAGTGFAYKFTPSGVVTVLHEFSDTAAGGQYPTGGLVQGNDGNFYGLTSGGSDNGGLYFQLTPAGGYAVLSSRPTLDAVGYVRHLVKGLDGDFYGVFGGENNENQGSIFKVTSAGVFTILHSFGQDPVSGGVDGQYPTTSPIVGSDGNFYGTTRYGGTNGVGTVYKMAPDGTVTLLHSFTGNETSAPDGVYPYHSLVQGLDGNFYGTTDQGGTGQGTVFKITPTGVFTHLYSFNPTKSTLSKDGQGGSLTLGPDGNFYGVNDTFFKITPDGVETVLVDASGGIINALDGLILGTDGNFYGGDDQIFKVVLNPAYGTLQFAASAYSVDENAGSVTLSVSRVGGSTAPVSISYDLKSDTAAVGFDTGYPPFPTQLDWADGDVAPKTITVPINDRGITDGSTRRFTIALSAATGGATLGSPAVATVTINENDAGAVAKPAVTSATAANGVVSAAFSYQITASNSPTSFGATGLPDGLSVNAAGLISGTPTAAGAYPVTISATNSGGTGTATLTITVAPVPTSAGTADLTISVADSPDPVLVGGQVRYVFTVSNKGPDTATNLQGGFVKDSKMTLVSAASVPGVTTANTNVLSFSLPDLASGGSESYTLAFTADGAGVYTVAGSVQASQTDPATADNSLLETTEARAGTTAAHAPVITAAPGGEIITGEAFAYQITTDRTVAVDSYSATGLPAGLSVSTTTPGLISGTLAKGTVTTGSFTVTLRVANGAGASNATRTFTVVDPPTTAKVIDVTGDLDNPAIKLLADKGKYKITGRVTLTDLGTKAVNPLKTPLVLGAYLSNSQTFSYPLVGDPAAAGLLPLSLTLAPVYDTSTGLVASYTLRVVVPSGTKTASTAILPVKLAATGKAAASYTLNLIAKASSADLPTQVQSGQYRYLLFVLDPAGDLLESGKSNNTVALDLQTLLGGS